MKIALGFLLLLGPFFYCHGQNIKPALQLIKGQTYYLASTGTSLMTQNVNGLENRTAVTLSYRVGFKIIGIKDTIYFIEASYLSVGMTIHTGDTSITMDSRKNDNLDTLSSIATGMVNKPFDITLSASGKVYSVGNLDKIIASLFYKYPQLDSAKKEQLKNRFIQSFGENTLKSGLEMGVAVFPGTPVNKNYQWVKNTSIGSPIKINVKTAYRLVEITNDFYQVHGEGTMTANTDSNSKSAEISGMPARYKLEGTTLTDIKIDKKTGWPMELIIKQLMAGEMEILDNLKLPGGKVIPMMLKAEVTVMDK